MAEETTNQIPPSDEVNSLSINSQNDNASSSSSTQMSVEERFRIVCSIGEECIQEDELLNLLTLKPPPICYDGFEPSGRMHIAQGIMKTISVNKLTSAGCKVKIWIADWFAQLNNKMGGDLKKIQTVGHYLIEIWKAVGMNLEGVEFLWSSEEINARAFEYWPLVMDTACRNKLPRIMRCVQIMGCSEQDELTAAQILYPCMQCADFSLRLTFVSWAWINGKYASWTSAGAREDAEVNVKIKKSYCPPKIVERNPCLDYINHIIFPWFNEFKVERSEANGGDKTYKNFEELVADYEGGNLHPGDLKPALSRALNKILQPVHGHFNKDANAKDLLRCVKSYRVTR